MKRILGLLLLLTALISPASAATFSAWEGDIPHTVVGEDAAAQIAEDTAVENGFRLNDVTLLRAVTRLVREDGTGRPVWVVSRSYMENETEQIHQYHAAVDAQTGEIQYDTKFWFEKMQDWEDELQCDEEFWSYEKQYLFQHLYNPFPNRAMPEESSLTLEDVRRICDYQIRAWSGLTITQEELDAYTMTATYTKREENSTGVWEVNYYLLDEDAPRYHLQFAYQVTFSEGSLFLTVHSWDELQGGLGTWTED